jgi:hypothetical protein
MKLGKVAFLVLGMAPVLALGRKKIIQKILIIYFN